MEDGDEHFGFGEGAVAADEAVEMWFTGVIESDWGVGDKRYVAEPTGGIGTHLRTEPALVDHLLFGADPCSVAVVLGGCGCELVGRPRFGVKPPEPGFAGTHRCEPDDFAIYGKDLGCVDLSVVCGDDQGRACGQRANHLGNKPVAELEFQVEIGTLETMYVGNVIEPVVVGVHVGGSPIETLTRRGDQR